MSQYYSDDVCLLKIDDVVSASITDLSEMILEVFTVQAVTLFFHYPHPTKAMNAFKEIAHLCMDGKRTEAEY